MIIDLKVKLKNTPTGMNGCYITLPKSYIIHTYDILGYQSINISAQIRINPKTKLPIDFQESAPSQRLSA